MKNRKIITLTSTLLLTLILFLYACSKGGDSGESTPPPEVCAGVTITLTTSAQETIPGASTGSITITSPTGTGFTYKLNNGNYQGLPGFSNLAKGTYTITAKNAAGCTGTATAIVNERSCSGTPGPKFTEVKTIVQNKCAISGCHVAPAPTGNLNLQVECNIVFNREKIFDRAVTVGDMPQTGSLTNAEKLAITAWINAGGRITD